MNLVELFRQPTPGHSQVVPGGLQITVRGSSEVIFKKIKREAEKSG